MAVTGEAVVDESGTGSGTTMSLFFSDIFVAFSELLPDPSISAGGLHSCGKISRKSSFRDAADGSI
jgi:hypothetical protein